MQRQLSSRPSNSPPIVSSGATRSRRADSLSAISDPSAFASLLHRAQPDIQTPRTRAWPVACSYKSSQGCVQLCRRSVAACAAQAQAETEGLTTQAAQDLIDAKSAMLLDILTSGTRVEQKLAEYASEVDPIMMGLLERRIEAAVRCDEEEKHIQGLQILYRRLRVMLDRKSAKSTELLLDDLLNRMAEPDWSDTEEQQQEVMECMRLAFGLPEPEVNIFGLASSISSDDVNTEGDGQPSSSAMEDDLPTVSIPDFAQDSREILKGTLKDCVELRKALESRQYEDKVQILQQTLSERILLAKQVEELIRMADQVTSGLSSLQPSLDVQIDNDSDENG